MQTPIMKSGALGALALLAMSTANASIIPPNAAGGSEAMLTVVNSSNATITQDLGEQISQINNGDTYNLSAAVQSFISAAGGLGSVSFAVIAGDSTARTYITTSADADLVSLAIANSERNVWSGTVTQMTGQLNSGDATATTVNNTYGPFSQGTAGNYLDGGWDLWNGAYVVNTGAGNADLLLYKVVFGTNNLSNATITSFIANPADSFARLVAGTTNQLQIGTAVPAPAAAWLLGTGLLGLYGRSRRRSAN